jgi:hypothetical protein
MHPQHLRIDRQHDILLVHELGHVPGPYLNIEQDAVWGLGGIASASREFLIWPAVGFEIYWLWIGLTYGSMRQIWAWLSVVIDKLLEGLYI